MDACQPMRPLTVDVGFDMLELFSVSGQDFGFDAALAKSGHEGVEEIRFWIRRCAS